MTNTGFLKGFGLAASLLLMAAGGVNYLVNPYSFFDTPQIEGVNVFHPPTNAARFVKPYRVSGQGYRGMVIGTSRAEAIPVEHRFWADRPAYNYAIYGGTFYELFRNAQHAIATNPVEQMVVGLDMVSFQNDALFQSGFAEERLAVDMQGNTQKNSLFLADHASVLLSQEAMRKSVQHFLLNRRAVKPAMTTLAGEDDRQPLDDSVTTSRHHVFAAIEAGFLKRNGYWLKSPDQRPHLKAVPGGVVDQLAWFERLLDMAHRRKLDVHLYISPLHARLQLAIHIMDIWAANEHWKQDMVAINAAVAARHGRQPYPLWDFYGFNEYTMETIPATLDQPMQWYTESSHFTPAFGAVLLERMGDPSTRQNPGVNLATLDARALQSHFRSIRDGAPRYAASHVEDAQAVYEMILATGVVYRTPTALASQPGEAQ